MTKMEPLMNSASHSRGIITLAYGHKRFIEQARSLAHSLQLHAPHLPRTLVTDSCDPEIRKLFTQVISYRSEYGNGVRQKLYLDQYSPYEKTLFIDSDCLALGNLDAFWSVFDGQYFGVPGYRYLQKGSTDPFLNVDHALKELNLTAIPKFNGGTYYFERSSEASEFFTTARNILDNFKTLGLCEFRRNGPNDESVYALAMAIHKLGPTSMGPGGMWTPVGYKGPLLLNALKGKCSFEKEEMQLFPEIIHFPGEYMYCFAYARERAKLRARIEGTKSPASALAVSFGSSVLWQCSRKVSGLSKLAKKTLRAYRSARSFAARAS
jgi:hypothetical protein